MSVPSATSKPEAVAWRTPAMIVTAGCLIAMISFGPRSSIGFFLTPLSQTNHWGRDVFAFALAIQNLLWGVGQPFAGAIADRYGAPRVLSAGAVLYAIGTKLSSSLCPGGVVNVEGNARQGVRRQLHYPDYVLAWK